MLKSILQKNKADLFFVFLLFVLLVSVRFLENKLFYDPFLIFFKQDYHTKQMPELNNYLLFISYFFRYAINSALSISIIYLLFKQIQMLKFFAIVYFVLFILLISIFYFFIYVVFIDWQIIFYIRRFIIQPLFLLLFIPALLFQQLTNNFSQKDE